MNAIERMIRKFSRPQSEPTNGTPPVMEDNYPILCGLVPKGRSLQIVFEDQGQRGFKQAIIPADLMRRYNRAVQEWDEVQDELARIPTANRKRKSRASRFGEPTEP